MHHYFGEKAKITTADTFKTEQNSSKTSKLINNTTGKGKKFDLGITVPLHLQATSHMEA